MHLVFTFVVVKVTFPPIDLPDRSKVTESNSVQYPTVGVLWGFTTTQLQCVCSSLLSLTFDISVSDLI